MASPSVAASSGGAQVKVRVPATSANLGPGFDALGLALGMYDELTLRTSDEPGLRIHAYDDVPTDETNLVAQAARAGFSAVGEQPIGLELEYVGRIPHARGLGSSAAAICAGVTAALAITGVRDRELAYRVAFGIERHPDNIAAAIYGGLTIAWIDDAGQPAAVVLTPSPDIIPVVFVPQLRTSTVASRGTLPQSVSHLDAARNAGRAALLVAALTSNPGELLAATEDRLHQPYRLPGLPEGGALITQLRAAGVAAVLSGSGPSILALCVGNDQVALAHDLGGGAYESCEPAVDLQGTTCSESVSRS